MIFLIIVEISNFNYLYFFLNHINIINIYFIYKNKIVVKLFLVIILFFKLFFIKNLLLLVYQLSSFNKLNLIIAI